ncbi:transglutaminase-like domain-containing protein [Clostridiaceae bacterium M8S5]|nr:transglutaminase-like domain-containing protein [Clostridiaceae bacterium M8S5]
MKSRLLSLINIGISYVFLFYILRLLNLELSLINTSIVIILPVVISILINLMFKNKKITLLILIIILTVGLFLALKYKEEYKLVKETIADFITWAIRFIKGYGIIHKNYSYVLIAVLSIVITNVCYLLYIKNKSIILKLLSGTAIFLISWFYYIDFALNYYIVYCFFMLILIGNKSYQIYNKSWSKNKSLTVYVRESKWLKYAIISSFILTILVAILPKDIAPISWPWLDRAINSRFPQLAKWRNDHNKSLGYGTSVSFDLSITELQSEKNRLGGPITPSNTLMFRVRGEERKYLRGRVSNTYTGFHWKREKTIFTKQIGGSNLKYFREGLVKGKVNNLVIEHVGISTSTIFAPLVSNQVHIEGNNYVNRNFEMFNERMIMKNENYKVYYVKNNSLGYRGNFRELTNKQKQECLQIPNIVPDRVKELAEQITAGYDNDLDKLTAIENYLRTYEYTYEAQLNPYNRDFVDYFLFDTKKGYCTYFASAMVILARSVDIPTRYVEGFSMPQAKKDGYYEVYSDNAHAWVEAYIKERGWITFEPTPAYELINHDIEEEKEDKKQQITKDYKSQSNTRKMKAMLDLEEEMNFSLENINNKDKNKSVNILIILYIVLILIGLVISIFALILYRNNRKIKQKKIKISGTNEIVKYYVSYINKIIERNGTVREEQETISEFFTRAESKLQVKEIALEKVLDIYLRSIYSKGIIDKDDIKYVRDYYYKWLESKQNNTSTIKNKYLYYEIDKKLLL